MILLKPSQPFLGRVSKSHRVKPGVTTTVVVSKKDLNRKDGIEKVDSVKVISGLTPSLFNQMLL